MNDKTDQTVTDVLPCPWRTRREQWLITDLTSRRSAKDSLDA